MAKADPLYIGLMSGTSCDGVDGVLCAFPSVAGRTTVHMLAAAYLPFPASLQEQIQALQAPGHDEIAREAEVANQLAELYGACVRQLLDQAGLAPAAVRAIGAHGQTLRHQPALGYTRQANNPALLAERCGIDVIADLRSRDIAAGGQGAPLVPAFHHALFAREGQERVVANIGGIGNISILPGAPDGAVTGFDTGPGNVLLDAWIAQHLQRAYDDDGAWAAQGHPLPALLQELLAEPFFALAPPKSTGRDLFHMDWLARKLAPYPTARPADVQATLTSLTSVSLAQAIARHAPATEAVYVCGGGAYNRHLLQQLQRALQDAGLKASLDTTASLGVAPNHVEALAFAWLAQRFCERAPGNLPAVTGASGPRVLGALYPA